ncbi:MAG TPA: isoleucine--tRNA ligase [Caldisericia bacterium]|nr:isoleucine--tRNA ligase [Caldisericia bacterium]
MFEELGEKSIVSEEMETLEFWKKNDIFKKSISQREGRPHYVFFEGPPTANGMPGIHHCLSRIYKDTVCRYKAMEGFIVDRKAGWDTHGLPVELEVEKKLGLHNKKEIEDYGIEAFIKKCKESVFTYEKEWVKLTERIAFWLDFEHQYMTLSNTYVESLWWILAQTWKKGLLYKGHKVVPYCPRCGTSLSSHEVAQGYQETKDPSITVKMEVLDEPGTYFLVWTTTPWTLPANVALAVKADATYVLAEKNGERYILVETLAQKVLEKDYQIVKSFPGKELVGKKYKPLYSFIKPDKNAHYVVAGDFVGTEDGTGIVHIAPAFGADDMEVARQNDLPVIITIDDAGKFLPQIELWKGIFVKDADPEIITEIKKRGLLYKSEKVTHTYPFCWRCDSPLLYFAKPSWYIKMSQLRDKLLENNSQVNWYPQHIKEGRFGEWLREVKDWAISRERYWGTPLPIWVCDSCGHQEAIESIRELREKSPETPENIELHRPYVDSVTYKCPKCGGTMKRVPEVVDCWFDSGSMPYAQWHWPFENKEMFETHFPADYICEAIDQTRGWFYTLMAFSTILFGVTPYKNVLCLELIVDENGQKMSKSRGNVLDPWLVLNNQGADALRWTIYTASPPWTPSRLGVNTVTESFRQFILLLRNIYSFFSMYANIDGFDPTKQKVPLKERHYLDRWIISELNTLVSYVDEEMKKFGITSATRAITAFTDTLANWYVRRSRRRFWKSESDQDKASAYHTLYEVLVTLSKLLAPFTPYFAERLYQTLVVPYDKTAPVSVHLCDLQKSDPDKIDKELERRMEFVRDAVSVGLKARKSIKIRVRQPLSKITIRATEPHQIEAINEFSELILDELNVKKVETCNSMNNYCQIKVKPNLKTLGKRFGAKLASVKEKIESEDGHAIISKLESNGKILLNVDGANEELSKEDLLIERNSQEGTFVDSDGQIEVMLTTTLTPELEKEGLAREVIHAIQGMRKEAGFAIDDKIKTAVTGSNAICEAVHSLKDYVSKETLSQSISFVLDKDPLLQREFHIEGETLTVAIWLFAKGAGQSLRPERTA